MKIGRKVGQPKVWLSSFLKKIEFMNVTYCCLRQHDHRGERRLINMRFNFQKISAVLTSVVMVGATAGFAAAANYPAPFVAGSTADAAVVHGTGAGVSELDRVQALNINLDLQSKVGSGGGTVTTTCAGGDCYLWEQASTKLNLNDTLVGVKSGSVDDTELPNVLAELDYISGDGKTYGYIQKIDIDPGLGFKTFADTDYLDKKPSVGVHLKNNQHVLEYAVSWKKVPESDVTSAGRLEDLESSDIVILGRTYTILNAYNASVNSNQVKLELMGGAFIGSINAGEVTTATLEGSTYAVRAANIVSASDADLCVSIDSGAEKCYDDLNEGETRELDNGVQIGVRDINYHSKTGTIDSVDFSLGAQKLTLQNTQTVELNDEDINGLTATITQTASGSKETLGNIILNWTTEDEEFIADENEVEIPGFGGIKLSSGGFYVPTKEITKIDTGSKVIEIETTIDDGPVTIPILYGNESTWTVVGGDTDEFLVTTNNTAITYNQSQLPGGSGDYRFVASWNSTTDAETYYLSVNDVYRDSGINYTKIKNEVTGSVICDVKNGDDCKVGNVVLTTSAASWSQGAAGGNGREFVTLTINSGGTFNHIYTKEGLVINLPLNANTSIAHNSNGTYGNFGETVLGQDGGKLVLNTTGATAQNAFITAWEEDKDGNIAKGANNVTVTLGWSGSKSRVSNVYSQWSSDAGINTDPNLETVDNSNIYVDWVKSDLGSMITHNRPSGSDAQYSAEIEYHGGESYGLVYLADPAADVGKVGSVTTTSGVTQIGNIIVKDSEVSSVANKNLIIVGGTCINSAAAKALGVSTGTCGSEFTDATGVGSGEFLIQSVGGAFSAGKIALVVAGYNADDTVNAATFLTNKPVDTTAGSKYKGTSATEATIVVA